MEEKMDSENSYSGDSTSSSSDSSSGSSECDEEVTEAVRILGQTLELPQDLCEDYSVFREFFSMKTWDSLEDKHKEHLKTLLPDFKENDEEEKDTTIEMLFNCEPFHFSSPLNLFFNNLRQGNYRPDIARMRKFLMKARAKQQRHKIKSYYAKILPEVLLSRERLLAVAKAVPPGPTPYIPSVPPKPSAKNNYKPLYVRARQRYFEELAAIWSEVGCDESEDDNYPEGAPESAIKKRRMMHSGQNMDTVSGTLGSLDSSHPSSIACLKNVLATHRARRQYKENHPELNIAGITLEDIKQRVSLVNGAKKLMFGGQKVEPPIHKVKKAAKGGNQKLKELKSAIKKVKEDESVETKPLLPNIKIKCEPDASDSENSSFLDPVTSPKHKKLLDLSEIKQEVSDSRYYGDSDLERTIKEEPQDSVVPNSCNSKISQPVPIKLEDLDGLAMDQRKHANSILEEALRQSGIVTDKELPLVSKRSTKNEKVVERKTKNVANTRVLKSKKKVTKQSKFEHSVPQDDRSDHFGRQVDGKISKGRVATFKKNKLSIISIKDSMKVSAIQQSYDVDVQSKTKGSPMSLYRLQLPITKGKYDDLMKLCRDQVIPARFHQEYSNIPKATNVKYFLPESDIEDEVV